LIEQLPVVKKVSSPPDVIVQTARVVELKDTGKLEVAVAESVGVVPNDCEPGLEKLMVCAALGVTAFDAAEAGPVPAAFVAVTLKL
jgi:hypothetical protein